MRILALDIASNTGAAWGHSDATPHATTWRLKKPHDDATIAAKNLGISLNDFCAVNPPDLIVIEAPIPPGALKGGNTNSDTIRILHGLAMGVHVWAGPRGIRCVEANVQTVRKHFLGTARPDNPKAAVLARCKQLGWMDADSKKHDAADALALWSWAAAYYGGHFGIIANAAGRA